MGNSDDDRSVKLNENEIEQLGKWELENSFSDIFKMYLSLDEYGKVAVENLIRDERLRCHDQKTVNDTSKINIIISIES